MGVGASKKKKAEVLPEKHKLPPPDEDSDDDEEAPAPKDAANKNLWIGKDGFQTREIQMSEDAVIRPSPAPKANIQISTSDVKSIIALKTDDEVELDEVEEAIQQPAPKPMPQRFRKPAAHDDDDFDDGDNGIIVTRAITPPQRPVHIEPNAGADIFILGGPDDDMQPTDEEDDWDNGPMDWETSQAQNNRTRAAMDGDVLAGQYDEEEQTIPSLLRA